MARDPYLKVKRGDKLNGNVSSILWNDMVDVVRWWKEQRPGGTPPIGLVFDATIVDVMNGTGADVPQNGVMAIGNPPIITPEQSLNTFRSRDRLSSTGSPAASDVGRFSVTIEPIADSSIGRCVVSGVVPCMVTKANGAKFCDVSDGQNAYLQAGSGSAQILWQDETAADPQPSGASATVYWSLIRIGNAPSSVLVKVSGPIANAGGKYDGTAYGGTWTDSGTGNLALPDGLTAGSSCLVLNTLEDGQVSHWLTDLMLPNVYLEGEYVGMSTEMPPRPIIEVEVDPTACTVSLGGAANADDPPGVYTVAAVMAGEMTQSSKTTAVSTPPAGMTAVSSCIVINTAETQLTNDPSAAGSVTNPHWLGTSWFGPGKCIGYTNDTPPKPKIEVCVPNPAATMYVGLSNDGGYDGNSTTPPSYTYTAMDIYGNTLGTNLTPQVGRPNGSFIAASYGLAYYGGDGKWVLLYAFEIPNTSTCT